MFAYLIKFNLSWYRLSMSDILMRYKIFLFAILALIAPNLLMVFVSVLSAIQSLLQISSKTVLLNSVVLCSLQCASLWWAFLHRPIFLKRPWDESLLALPGYLKQHLCTNVMLLLLMNLPFLSMIFYLSSSSKLDLGSDFFLFVMKGAVLASMLILTQAALLWRKRFLLVSWLASICFVSLSLMTNSLKTLSFVALFLLLLITIYDCAVQSLRKLLMHERVVFKKWDFFEKFKSTHEEPPDSDFRDFQRELGGALNPSAPGVLVEELTARKLVPGLFHMNKLFLWHLRYQTALIWLGLSFFTIILLVFSERTQFAVFLLGDGLFLNMMIVSFLSRELMLLWDSPDLLLEVLPVRRSLHYVVNYSVTWLVSMFFNGAIVGFLIFKHALFLQATCLLLLSSLALVAYIAIDYYFDRYYLLCSFLIFLLSLSFLHSAGVYTWFSHF